MYARTLANTGPRWYLVVEFDTGSLDSQAARLWHLATIWPLAIAVFSGGKSLHGWFPCRGESESPTESLAKFFNYAVTLGADTATWTRSQFVRMPDAIIRQGEGSSDLLHDALRKAGEQPPKERLQAVVYFNREVIR